MKKFIIFLALLTSIQINGSGINKEYNKENFKAVGITFMVFSTLYFAKQQLAMSYKFLNNEETSVAPITDRFVRPLLYTTAAGCLLYEFAPIGYKYLKNKFGKKADKIKERPQPKVNQTKIPEIVH